MTRKGYNKFVTVWQKSIRFMGNPDFRSHHYLDADAMYKGMCEIFFEDNERFDEQRFRDAIDNVIQTEEDEWRRLPM